MHAALCVVPLLQRSTSFTCAHTLNPFLPPFFFFPPLLLPDLLRLEIFSGFAADLRETGWWQGGRGRHKL
jgi:hypothetical protein